MTNKAPDPYINRAILGGQFLIEQKIGSGGMGAVYRAAQPAMNRLVAVKILHPKLTNRKDLASRFRREARAMSHLQHPNTVRVFLFGDLEDGSLYIVMEYLEGRNLNQTVRKEGPLPVDRAIPILIQCCGALQEAHSQGIVHRDLKPENIFLSTNGGLKDYPKVLDFGLAKVTERELRPGSIMLTQEGMVFGTPEFMSPEQAQGKVLDARSDIYSLATILYEVLTGKLPFDAKTPMEYIQLHVTKPPISLDERVPGKRFPAGLAKVIAKALEKKPEDRYPTAADFADALKPFAMGRTFSAIMPGGAQQKLPPTLDATQNDAPKHNVAKTVRMEVPPAAGSGRGVPAPAGSGRGVPAPPNSGPGLAAPPVVTAVPPIEAKRGLNVTVVALIAVVCVLIGVGLAVVIMHLR
jgi:eukaryotic-like serine/threonine-protein kinase